MYKRLKVLKSIRASMKDGKCLTNAIGLAGLRSPETIRKWRNSRPLIDRYIDACQTLSDDNRNARVEDKLFDRLMKGEANSIEYIFYLSNRLSDRWKDKRAIVNNQQILKIGEGNGQSLREAINRLPKDKAEEILKLLGNISGSAEERNGRLLSA